MMEPRQLLTSNISALRPIQEWDPASPSKRKNQTPLSQAYRTMGTYYRHIPFVSQKSICHTRMNSKISYFTVETFQDEKQKPVNITLLSKNCLSASRLSLPNCQHSPNRCTHILLHYSSFFFKEREQTESVCFKPRFIIVLKPEVLHNRAESTTVRINSIKDL